MQLTGATISGTCSAKVGPVGAAITGGFGQGGQMYGGGSYEVGLGGGCSAAVDFNYSWSGE